jgi:hypothetical protein
MESAYAEQTRAKLYELATDKFVDGYDREFIANVLDEASLDYLSAVTNRRIEKILGDAEFRKRHPNATRI